MSSCFRLDFYGNFSLPPKNWDPKPEKWSRIVSPFWNKGGGPDQHIVYLNHSNFWGLIFDTLKTRSENSRCFCFVVHEKFLKMHHFFGGSLLRIPTTSLQYLHIRAGMPTSWHRFLARGVSTSYGSGGLCIFYMANRCKKEVPKHSSGNTSKVLKGHRGLSCKIPWNDLKKRHGLTLQK